MGETCPGQLVVPLIPPNSIMSVLHLQSFIFNHRILTFFSKFLQTYIFTFFLQLWKKRDKPEFKYFHGGPYPLSYYIVVLVVNK